MPELQRPRADHADAVLTFELANRAYFADSISARGDDTAKLGYRVAQHAQGRHRPPEMSLPCSGSRLSSGRSSPPKARLTPGRHASSCCRFEHDPRRGAVVSKARVQPHDHRSEIHQERTMTLPHSDRMAGHEDVRGLPIGQAYIDGFDVGEWSIPL